jgi:Fe-S cluster biogenesis protein NfuA
MTSHKLPQAPPTPARQAAAPIAPQAGSLTDRVTKVLNLIRPAVQSDGGDVELVGITPDNVAQIRLHGACVGCPSSSLTLQMGIERNLRTYVPEIRSVQAVP